jgi:hypothetical protein
LPPDSLTHIKTGFRLRNCAFPGDLARADEVIE